MKLKKLHKNWNPLHEIFELSKEDIEFQVLQDMQKYNQLYFQKYGKAAPLEFDVDNFVSEMWGFEIFFEEIEQTEGEEVLGYLRPQERKIVVDDGQCRIKERINFTIAHEAGHLSLHASMLRMENGLVVGWSSKPIEPQFVGESRLRRLDRNQQRMEWQANKYASAILAPKHKVHNVLSSFGLIRAQQQITPLDLNTHSAALMEKFGLSRQALEIRLSDLKIDVLNRKY